MALNDPNAAATVDAAVTGNEAWAIVSRLIAGMLIYGAIGWIVGQTLGNAMIGSAVGVLVGAALGLYLSVVRIRQLGDAKPVALVVSESTSWAARMRRARMDRARRTSEGGNGD